MGVYTAKWEDKSNHRLIELAVSYRVDGSDLEIESVTPASVTFFCRESGEAKRKIGIHTHAGRRVLMGQFERHVGMDQLEQELSSTLTA